jgi:8-oxo-dGTP pyrophosphatase MutT (NUDIX family)
MVAEGGDLIETLRRTLAGRPRVRLDRPERAAVLVPIVDDGEPLRLLLTRRTQSVATHQGQVAFPGGFVEAGEEDPVRTALREAWEEIGLPAGAVEILGLLDDHPTRTDAVAVTPVVGRLARLPDLAPQTAEVARIFTIPVAELRRPERWRSRTEPTPAGPRAIHFFDHEGETLWGLSARIVRQLLDLPI